MKKPFKEWPVRRETLQKGERKNLLMAQDMTRREFLRAGLGLATAASGMGLLAGRAAAQPPKDQITSSQGKPDHKIYPPKDGCLVGFHKEQHRRFQLGREISATIDHYRNALGASPATIAFWSFLSLGFPTTEAETMRERGVVPYINIMPGHAPWENSFGPDDVVRGRCDRYIKKLAADAARFGEQQGGVLLYDNG